MAMLARSSKPATQSSQHRSGGSNNALPSTGRPEAYVDTSNKEEDTCVICFEDMKGGKARMLRSSATAQGVLYCGHRFCAPCIATYISKAIGDGETASGSLRCPIVGCSIMVDSNVIKKMVNEKDWAKHQRFADQFTKEAKIHKGNKSKKKFQWCPNPGCEGIIKLDLSGTNTFSCPACQGSFCSICNEEAHPTRACKKEEDQLYVRWKAKKPVKPCPGCGHHIYKEGGCRLMYCKRCKTSWCWTCGKASFGCTCRFLGAPPNAMAEILDGLELMFELLFSWQMLLLIGAAWILSRINGVQDDCLKG